MCACVSSTALSCRVSFASSFPMILSRVCSFICVSFVGVNVLFFVASPVPHYADVVYVLIACAFTSFSIRGTLLAVYGRGCHKCGRF